MRVRLRDGRRLSFWLGMARLWFEETFKFTGGLPFVDGERYNRVDLFGYKIAVRDPMTLLRMQLGAEELANVFGGFLVLALVAFGIAANPG